MLEFKTKYKHKPLFSLQNAYEGKVTTAEDWSVWTSTTQGQSFYKMIYDIETHGGDFKSIFYDPPQKKKVEKKDCM